MKNLTPNFGIAPRRIQNRYVLVNRDTLVGYGLFNFIVGFRHNTLLLGGFFRCSETLLVILLDGYDAFDCRRCRIKLSIRQVRCRDGRTRRN